MAETVEIEYKIIEGEYTVAKVTASILGQSLSAPKAGDRAECCGRNC